MIRRLLLAVLLLCVASGVFAATDFDPGGVGLMKIRPLLERRRKPTDVRVIAWPMGRVEVAPTFCLIERAPTLMMLAIANPKSRDLKDCRVVVDLPAGVSLKATNAYLDWTSRTAEAARIGGKPYTRVTLRVSPAKNTLPMGKARNAWYATHRPVALWLSSGARVGARLGPVRLALSYTAKKGGAMAVGESSSIALKVLPPLKAQRPKLARSGLMGRCSVSYDASHKEAARIVADYQVNMGCNITFDGPPQSMLPEDVARWSEGRNLWQIYQSAARRGQPDVGVGNGFFLHSPAAVIKTLPDAIKLVTANGHRLARDVAPWAAYGRHPWVVKHVLDPIAAAIERGEMATLWANWEPGGHVRNAGFSEGTKRAFITWSKLPAAEVTKLWGPKLVKKYPAQWRAFRSWEIGKWTKVLAGVVRKAAKKAGRDERFIVATTAAYMYRHDLLLDNEAWGDFPYVFQTWSYHNTPQVHERYPVSDHRGAPQVVRSGRLARRLDKLFGVKRQVQGSCLYGWDQSGYHTGYMEPEHVGFRQLSTVMGGLEVVHSYGEWPIFDGRYAHALARANTRIARWEAYTLKGTKQRAHVVIPVSPYPQTVAPHTRPADQEPTTWDDYLYSYEYAYDSTRLIAVANCWDFGEVFVKLRVPGLDARKRYVLTEPEAKRLFANSRGDKVLTAADLAEGLTVHVGAMRWGCFLLQPAEGAEVEGMDLLTPRAMKTAMADRFEGLLATLNAQEKVWGAQRRFKVARGFVTSVAPDCSKRAVIVNTSATAPKVDGVLDDACWRDTKVHGAFKTFGERATPKTATTWQAVVKDDTLHLGVACAQDMTRPTADATKRDGPVWRDDSVEIFINPFEPRDGRDYCQIIVNAKGVVFDSYRGNSRGWNEIKAVAAAQTREGWTFEVAIPLAKIGIRPSALPVMRFNVVRNVVGSKHNVAEASSWFPTWDSNANMAARGIVVFRR